MQSNHKSNVFILFILSIALLFDMSMWFAPNAVFDQLIPKYNLTDTDLSIISISIIGGFIIGSLLSAFLNLPDLIPGDRLFFMASILGAISSILIIFAPNVEVIWVLRLVTGIALAGVYPVAMKLTASHFKENRGLAIGILIGALTTGSGLPYLFNLFGEPDWKAVIILVTLLAIISGLIVLTFVHQGPHVSENKNDSFDIGAIKRIYSKESVRLANIGYFGHMWELYAFWVWIPIFLKESYSVAHPAATDTQILKFFSLGAFLVFFLGAIANAVGGYFSDRIGRAKFNILMLTLSGSSGLIIGFFFNSPIVALIIALIWGTTIVPDSPQYSTLISELADQELVGTALTIQTAIGFTITMTGVRLVPILKDLFDWQWVFPIFAIGPIIGIYAMWKLKSKYY